MTPLSVVIITKNEAQNIPRCLESLSWASEIVVVDSGSQDTTVEICLSQGCRVVISPWLGFGPTKQLAVDRATHDWVLSVDADEKVSSPLRAQIIEIISDRPPQRGYRVGRVSNYLGYPIRYSGWQRDFPLRLFNRRHGAFDQALIHEQVRVEGAVGTLPGPLYHDPYPTIGTHLEKISRYARLGARKRSAAGKAITRGDLIFRGPLKFLKMYLLRQGFRDGMPGLVLAGMSAYGVALKYYLSWEMAAASGPGNDSPTRATRVD